MPRPCFVRILAFVCAAAAALGGPAARAAEPVQVFAAGSLAGAIPALIAASGIPAEAVAKPAFGPAGLMRERIERGEHADLLASADMAQPQRLADAGKALPPVPFARNRMCVVAKPALGLTPDNLLDKLLAPATRLATSTPGADPGGDYALAVFDRADKLRAGAGQVLRDKAMHLIGGPNTMTPVNGKSPAASIFLADRADALLYYCSGVPATLREVPDLVKVVVPPALDPVPVYGLAIIGDNPQAMRLALFMLSAKGQAILAQSGLLPVLAEPDAPATQASAPADGVTVTGQEGAATAFDGAALAKLPRVPLEVSYETDKGIRKASFEGPLLWDVLVQAKAIDPAAPRGQVRQVVLLEGRDGYTAALGLGEIAPAFEGKQVILADRMDGAPLPSDRWRIVVPGDRRGGRGVRDLARIAVLPAPPAPAAPH